MPSPKPPFLLTLAQMRRLSPHFPLSHGIARVDDRRVLSGIIYVIGAAFCGEMHPRPTVLTRRSTIGSSAGAAWACSTASSPHWPPSPAPNVKSPLR